MERLSTKYNDEIDLAASPTVKKSVFDCRTQSKLHKENKQSQLSHSVPKFIEAGIPPNSKRTPPTVQTKTNGNTHSTTDPTIAMQRTLGE